MVDALTLGLRFAHILLGVVWMGAILLFVLFLIPMTKRMSHDARRGFFLTYGKPLSLLSKVASTGTILAGLALYAEMYGAGRLFDTGDRQAVIYLAAFVLALALWAEAWFLFFPKLKRALAIIEDMVEDGPPPPELLKLTRSMDHAGHFAVVTVLAILGLMVWGQTGGLG